MEFVGYYSLNGERIDNFKLFVQKEIDNYIVSSMDMVVPPTIEYYELYKADKGMTNKELEYHYGINLDDDKNKYLIAKKMVEIDIEEKLKEKFVGYRLLDFIKRNGKTVVDYFPVFDGNVYKIEMGGTILLFSDGEFGILKYVLLSKEEFENLLKRNNNDKNKI